MKSSVSGLTAAAVALAASLGLTLAGPHRAYAAPDSPITQGDSELAVTILSPTPRSTYSGDKPVEISAFYQGGSGSPITTLELFVDGAKAATKRLDAPESRGVVSFLVDASALTGGTHRIVVRATAADAEVTSAKSSFTFQTPGGGGLITQRSTDVPNTAPELSFASPSLDSKVQGTVTIKVNASDPSGKSPYVSLFIDRAFKTLKNYPPYEFEWDTTAYSNGLHTIEAFAYNEAQNVAHAKPLRVYVNNPGGRTERRTDLKDAAPKAAHKPLAPKTALAPARKKPARPPRRSAAMLAGSPAAKPHAAHARIAPGLDLTLLAAKPGLTPGLSDPFVHAPAAPPTAKARALTPTGGFKPFKPLPARPVSGVLAAAPVTAGEPAGPPLLRMANAALPAETLASPFLAAPRVSASKLAAPKTVAAAVPTAPMLKAHARRAAVHTPATAASLLRSKGQTAVLFNSTVLRIDRPLAAQGGLMFGPLRQIFEFSGGSLEWDGATGTVTGKTEAKSIQLTIGLKHALVNDQPVLLEGAPYLNDGRTMVPLSFLPTALDVDVQYDAVTGHLLITSKQ